MLRAEFDRKYADHPVSEDEGADASDAEDHNAKVRFFFVHHHVR